MIPNTEQTSDDEPPAHNGKHTKYQGNNCHNRSGLRGTACVLSICVKLRRTVGGLPILPLLVLGTIIVLILTCVSRIYSLVLVSARLRVRILLTVALLSILLCRLGTRSSVGGLLLWLSVGRISVINR